MQENDPLIFKYADILEEGGRSVELSPAPAVYADAFDKPETVKSMHLEMEFSVGGDSILLEGKLRGEFVLDCSRCGDPVTRTFEDSFDEVYPDTVEYIDTRELVRETAALLVPMKVLCSDECKGRCLVCGINRNQGTCSCNTGRTTAFDVLRSLKVESQDKPGNKKL
jgi:uncharacterized protein